jgi:hypothetical protein
MGLPERISRTFPLLQIIATPKSGLIKFRNVKPDFHPGVDKIPFPDPVALWAVNKP